MAPLSSSSPSVATRGATDVPGLTRPPLASEFMGVGAADCCDLLSGMSIFAEAGYGGGRRGETVVVGRQVGTVNAFGSEMGDGAGEVRLRLRAAASTLLLSLQSSHYPVRRSNTPVQAETPVTVCLF